jgi:hypothetical protein
MSDIEIGSTLEGLKSVELVYEASTDIVAFVGQNPSAKAAKGKNTFPRLNDWVEKLGLDTFTFMNAYPHPGKCKVSQVNLDNLRKALYKFPRVVALGNFAAEALMKAGIDHFKLPHPSPLNRQINDDRFINKCLEECREYLNTKSG